MKLAWSRLISFVAVDGRVLCGEPILPSPDFDLGKTTEKTKLKAKIIVGNDISDDTGATKVSDEIVTVKKLLGPLTAADVDILRCVGLNYGTHTGRVPPPFPFIFFKPTTCIHDHNRAVEIPKIAQDDQADYEGGLVLVIGKDAKNVPLEEAGRYLAVYLSGDFSKGFDTFAPIGPVLVASDLVQNPADLLLRTIVDGETRQEKHVSDLLFDCAYLVSYLSQGTTLRKGSVIMTGTPGGVGAGLNPLRYLVPGTVMEVQIDRIRNLWNGVYFL
ncbi:hypothetical protein C7974DRAFT_435905 [Boeremia exigua]|uniref:uncharacterized protein n=1 Tax=Boeremia exigua TaxID=749465 RepID=UPI001E8CAF6D|nr:uncharacterized protein C7974DRAFT_435905 [Boeremia exigua]KAH6620600.1 hypothetical protein C7974DRAFT_435905 [Boeremia exigua]